jgi:soluble lytic murein transglycosylase-like protein
MRRALCVFALVTAAFVTPASAFELYRSEIDAASQRHGVPVELIEAIIRVESDGNRWAVSRTGARGLMQLMPGTAALLGVRDSFDPRQNIDGGVRHLTALIERFDNLPLVLAAYHAGAGAVTTYGGIPPYPETRNYVAKVMDVFAQLSRSSETAAVGRSPESKRTPNDTLASADPLMPPITRAELEVLVRAAMQFEKD